MFNYGAIEKNSITDVRSGSRSNPFKPEFGAAAAARDARNGSLNIS